MQLARQIPDLYRAQLTFFAGAYGLNGFLPRLLIPAVKTESDIEFVKNLAVEILPELSIQFGAMVETVAACNNIDSIAKSVSFISFGTNDLTSEVLNISRQDPNVQDHFRLLSASVIDCVAETVARARSSNPTIHISLCGEAASNIHSLMGLYEAGARMDSFSVAPTLSNTLLLPLVYGGHFIPETTEPISRDEFNACFYNPQPSRSVNALSERKRGLPPEAQF